MLHISCISANGLRVTCHQNILLYLCYMLGNKFGNSLALLNNLTTFAIKPEMSEILDVKITSGHDFSIYLKEHIAIIVALNI